MMKKKEKKAQEPQQPQKQQEPQQPQKPHKGKDLVLELEQLILPQENKHALVWVLVVCYPYVAMEEDLHNPSQHLLLLRDLQ